MKCKKTRLILSLALLLLLLSSCCNMPRMLPDSYLEEGFVYVKDVIPDAILDVRYYGNNNFIGRRIEGYLAPTVILTEEATEALKRASDDFRRHGYVVKLFDGFRPQRAVNDFIIWATDLEDNRMKSEFYPAVDKSNLFSEGYIARRSGHSRGSTIDLTLVSLRTGEELDMGSPFDFFGAISHHGSPLITPEQEENRKLLKDVMERAGFRAYDLEWWHYTLANEPYPDTYFDFPVR